MRVERSGAHPTAKGMRGNPEEIEAETNVVSGNGHVKTTEWSDKGDFMGPRNSIFWRSKIA